MRAVIEQALTTPESGPKVISAQSECMLNRQRREKPLFKKAAASGKRVVKERLGVDADVCDGDHACIRLSGRSEEHTSELQSLMRISYAVFCLKKKRQQNTQVNK